MAAPSLQVNDSVFSSWKEIASYLGKGVRTVQRWEHQLALPVHRPPGCSKGVVLAYRVELDSWAHRNTGALLDGNEPDRFELHPVGIRAHLKTGAALRIRCAELRIAHRVLMESLIANLTITHGFISDGAKRRGGALEASSNSTLIKM